jgi:hypothetical protein
MNVGELIAALWTVPSETQIEVLLDRRPYDIDRVFEERDAKSSVFLVRIREKKDSDNEV